MDVTIGEVQTQVAAPSRGKQAQPQEGDKRTGITEKARESRLAENRNKRIRERLSAT